MEQKDAITTINTTTIKINHNNEPTLRVVADMWIESLKPFCKNSTLVKYTNQLNNHIYPAFGERKISEITNQEIISFRNTLLMGENKSQIALSPKSTTDILSRIKAIRKFATIQGFEVGFIPECLYITQKRNDIRILSIKEQQTLFDFLVQDFDLTGLGIIICLFTGIRIGELCALTWDNISLIDKELHITHTMQRLQYLNNSSNKKTYISIDVPKSQSSIRTIPIPEIIIEYMRPYYSEGAYLLSGSTLKFVEPRTMENRFKSILNKCGIEDANFHALRHTFATRCVEIGFDIKSLSEILGHANVNITLNRYVHPSMQLKHENMNKFSKFFDVK